MQSRLLDLYRLKMLPLFGEAFWVLSGLGASMFALVIGTRYLTVHLTAEEFGRLSLVLSLATLAVQIGATPIALSALRFYSGWKEIGKLHVLLDNVRNSLAIVLVIVIIVSIVMAVGAKYWKLTQPQLAIMTGIFASLLVLNRVAIAFQDAVRERRMRALLQVFFEVGRFSLAALLIEFSGHKSAETVLAAFILAALGAVALQFHFLGPSLSKQASLKSSADVDEHNSEKKRFKEFFLPLIISNGCVWFVLLGERWSLQLFCNLSDVGGYTAVHQLSFMPMIAISSFLLILTTPILFQHLGIDQKSEKAIQALKINRYFSLVLILFTLLFFIVFYLFRSNVGTILLGESFRLYSWIFPWLFLAGGFFAAAQQLLLKLTSELQTRALALLWLCIATLAMIAYVTCTYYWQLHGLVCAVVCVNLVLLIVSFILSSRGMLLQ